MVRNDMRDHEKLQHLLGIESYDQLKDTHRRWVEESLTSRTNGREHKWTESISENTYFWKVYP